MKIDPRQIHVVQAVLLVLGIVLGALMLKPLRAQADSRAEIMKERIISQLEASQDVKISYKGVSPALLSTIVVRGLNVTFGQGDFRAETVRIHYNPFRSLTSDDLLRFVSRIAIKNGHLNLTVSSESPREQVAANGEIAALRPLFENKSVDLSGISAKIRLSDSVLLNADEVTLALNDEGGIVRYEIAGAFHVSGMGFLDNIREVRARASSNGSFSPTESTVHGRFNVLSASSEYVVLQPISMDFTYADGQLAARRVSDNVPMDLLINYSFDGWHISGKTEELKMTSIALSGISSAWFTPFFSSIVDGRFQLSASPSFDHFDYEVDMDVEAEPTIGTFDYKTKLHFRGSQDSMYIDTLQVSSELGNLSYVGVLNIKRLAPDGFLTLNLSESLLGYPAFARFNLNTREGVITARPEAFEANEVQFRDFRFFVIPEDDTFVASLIAVPESGEDPREKKLTMDVFVDSRTDLAIRAFVKVEGFETSLITRLLGLTRQFDLPFAGDFIFDMDGFFESSSKTWLASLDKVTLRHRNNPDKGLVISGRASPEGWSLDSLRATWNEYVVDGRGYGKNLAEGGYAEGRLLFGEQFFPLTARWFDDGSVTVDGDLGLEIYLRPGTEGERWISLVCDSVLIPLSDGQMVASLDLRGQIAVRGDLELYINRAQILLSGRSNKSDIDVAFNGSLSRDSLLLSKISITDDYGELTGSAAFETAGNSKILLGQVLLEGSGDERYHIDLVKNGDFWDIDLGISAARIERVMPERFSGELSLDGSLDGTLKNPSISLNLSSSNGVFDGQPFEAGAAISLESGLMRISDIQYSHRAINLDRGLVLLNMKEGSLKTTAELNATYNQVPVSSGLSLAVDFDGALAIAEIPHLLDLGYRGTMATQPVMWDSAPHLPAYTFHFSKDSDFFRIVSPDSGMLDLSYAYESGELNVLSGSKMPVVSRGRGTIKDGNIDFSFSELNIDPILANYVMYRDPILMQYYVVFQSGSLVGEFDISGPLNNPEINGELRVVDLKVDTPYTYAEIQPASTDIHFESHRITIDRIHVSVGDGMLYGGGSIVLDRFRIVECNIEYGATSTSKGAGVPVYYPLLGVNLDGIFTGEGSMTGGNKHFYLDGNFTFDELRASLGDSTKPVRQNRRSAYPNAFFLDFDFNTGNNCIFYLPNEEWRIIRATAEAGQTLNLVFSSDPHNLSLTGVLPIKTGDIYYFARGFRITEGSLKFNEAFKKFNPTLSIRAETRVKDEEGSDVQVALVYNAPIMSDFNPTIETIPPRSDILTLFGQAVAPDSNSQDNQGERVLLATSGLFGQMGIVQPFEEALKEELNLDMVSIQTDIIENTLEEGLTRDADSGLSSKSQSLGRYLDNTSMYVGKYIGDSLFFSGTVSANYLESQRSNSIFGGLEFRASADLEMVTPFFSILWSYSPNPQGSEGFVVDNAITLRRRFSY